MAKKDEDNKAIMTNDEIQAAREKRNLDRKIRHEELLYRRARKNAQLKKMGIPIYDGLPDDYVPRKRRISAPKHQVAQSFLPTSADTSKDEIGKKEKQKSSKGKKKMAADRQTIEKRLANIKATYLKLDQMIDSLPEEIPETATRYLEPLCAIAAESGLIYSTLRRWDQGRITLLTLPMIALLEMGPTSLARLSWEV